MSGKGLRTVTVIVFAVTMMFAAPLWAQETITVAGSGACQSLLRSLSASFTSANPGITVEVPKSIGTGGGVKAAAEEKVVLGRVARKLKDSEKGYGLDYMAFSKMSVVFAAHPSVPELNITSSQARDIFTGKITNWSAVGGPDKKIRVISRHSNEAGLLVLKADVPGWSGIELTTKSKQGTSDQETLQFIKSIDGAIGFGTFNQAKETGLTILSLDGASPSDAAYPASIEFGFVYKPARLDGAAKKFVDYMFTADAASVMNKNLAAPVIR